MSKTPVLLFVFLGCIFTHCTVPKKIQYNIPDDIQGNKREELLSTLENGRKLYELHCSSCHGIFSKGKEGIPDFTDKQIEMYTAYAIKRDPRNHAVAANMSPDQLHTVFMFLKARKIKSTQPVLIPANKKNVETTGK